MKTQIKKTIEIENINASKTIHETLEEAMKRVSLRFRISAALKLRLIDISKETGVEVANIIEAMVTAELQRMGRIGAYSNAIEITKYIGVPKDIFTQLEGLRKEQFFKLFIIYLNSLDRPKDFERDAGIKEGTKTFQLLDTLSLSLILKNYLNQNKIGFPTLECLLHSAATGYKFVKPFAAVGVVKMSSQEIEEISLAIEKNNPQPT